MHTKVDPCRNDYDARLNGQAALLRQGRLEAIDSELLAEELEAMGRRERNELVGRLVIFIAHLLRWHHQPAHRCVWTRSMHD